MSFFESSFEEFCVSRGYSKDATARIIWRTEATERFAMIKASPHYHLGVPCREDLQCRADMHLQGARE